MFCDHKFFISLNIWIHHVVVDDDVGKSIISTCRGAQYFQRSLKCRTRSHFLSRRCPLVSVLQIPVNCLLFIYPLWSFFVGNRLQILVWLGYRSTLVKPLKSCKTRFLFIRTCRIALTYFLEFLHSAVPSFEEIRCFGFASLFQLDAQLWCLRPLVPFLPSRNAFRLLTFFQTSRKYLSR